MGFKLKSIASHHPTLARRMAGDAARREDEEVAVDREGTQQSQDAQQSGNEGEAEAEGEGEEGASRPARPRTRTRGSRSPTAYSYTERSRTTSAQTADQQDQSTLRHQRRRDQVSVGSRVSRTVVVRPPYAARDELDFERRPRSDTSSTVTGIDSGTNSRHRHTRNS